MIRLRQSLVGEVLTAGCMFDPQNLKYKKKPTKVHKIVSENVAVKYKMILRCL